MLFILLPLAFGLAVTPWFSNIGTSIISSLVGVLFWPIGFLIVDTFVLKILQACQEGLNQWPGAYHGSGLGAVFWWLTSMNPLGFGLCLFLIGTVVLALTIVGYYASSKVITSLFGAAGGAISGALTAVEKSSLRAADAAAGVTVGAATFVGGAAAFGAGSALSMLAGGSASQKPAHRILLAAYRHRQGENSEKALAVPRPSIILRLF
jgi:hypothetical protein